MKKPFEIPTHLQIKPKERGRSDFFSWNLFAWLRKYPDLNRVYQTNWNRIDGTKGGWKNGEVVIGLLDSGGHFQGRGIRQASGLVRGQAYSYMGRLGRDAEKIEYRDITNKFWRKYLKIGVCALGPYRHDFEKVSATERHCQRCGYRQLRRTKHVRKYIWESLKK